MPCSFTEIFLGCFYPGSETATQLYIDKPTVNYEPTGNLLLPVREGLDRMTGSDDRYGRRITSKIQSIKRTGNSLERAAVAY